MTRARHRLGEPFGALGIAAIGKKLFLGLSDDMGGGMIALLLP